MTTGPRGPIRVLYVIDSLGYGGAEQSLAEMTPYLVRGGIDLHVAVLHDREGFTEQVRAGGAEVHSVADGRGRIGWLTRLMALRRSLQPDLVHTTLFDSDILGRIAAVVGRTPVVSSWVNIQYGEVYDREFPASGSKLAAVKVLDLVTSRVVRRFHAVSRPVAETMCTAMHVSPQRVDVIPRGRDRKRLGEPSLERRATVRRRLGLGAEPVVVNVARQDHAKGLDVLLRAWRSVVADVPDAVLLLAGRYGTRTQELHKFVDESGLRASARFLGIRNDVPDLLCAADAFVLPSRREGLPGALLEAMALEVPIVATAIDTIVEAVPGAEYACLVGVDDQEALARGIIETLSNRSGANGRAATSRTRFEECFTITEVTSQMRDLYERTLG